MSDWKNRLLVWRAKSYGGTGELSKKEIIAVLLGIYLFIAVLIGWYWSQEPDRFPVEQNAQIAAEKAGRNFVSGYTTVETLKTLANTLLHKPGGYISNDIAPPGLWLDNMPNWEFGVLQQIRDMARAMRRDFSRSQSQSAEDPDLANGEPLFHFDNNSWALPATESEYRRGIGLLDRYLARLSDPQQPKASFFTRADNLNNWLGDVANRLGSLSQRLSASIGRVDLEVTEPVPGEPGKPQIAEKTEKTPWLKIDDVFYEALGQAWALSQLLRAIEVDFAEVLERKNASASLQQIIQEFDAAVQPVWSPFILNGGGYGVLANHSLVMANFISRANAAVIDLRALLSQG